MEIEKDEKIKILKTKQKLSLCLKEYNLSNFLVSNCSLLIDKDKIKEFTIKEDELKNYRDEIKNLVKQYIYQKILIIIQICMNMKK